MLAIVVTLSMNADTFKMLRTLWNNPTLSQVLIEKAKVRLEKGRPDESQPMVTYNDPDNPTASTPTEIPAKNTISEDENQLLRQVAGWIGDWYNDWPDHETKGFGSWLWYLLTHRFAGWIVTILAVSLGAPFWFDTLNKFMNIRNAGKPPEKSSEQPTAEKPTPPANPAPAGAQ
jgi:hypothetical protein